MRITPDSRVIAYQTLERIRKCILTPSEPSVLPSLSIAWRGENERSE